MVHANGDAQAEAENIQHELLRDRSFLREIMLASSVVARVQVGVQRSGQDSVERGDLKRYAEYPFDLG